MENLRLHDSARTYGSNHLTNKLSVTALKRLLPVFLMMIFMGIGTDALGQETPNNGIFVIGKTQLNTFGGKESFGINNSYTSDDGLITVSTLSKQVQTTNADDKGTKIQQGGVFTITPNKGAKITSIFLETGQDNRKLTSNPEVTPESSGINSTDYTYTFDNVAESITFTNSNEQNIYVTTIQVNYKYSSSSLLPQLEGVFSNDVTDFKGKQINIPAPTVTAMDSPVDVSEYTVTYSSSNEEAVIIID